MNGSRTDGTDGETTVLIVEDDEAMAGLFADWLAPHHETRVAHDGEAGLDGMTDAVDAVLLNRRMPGMTGDEFLHAVKAEGYSAGVVMVTAVDLLTRRLEAAARDAGAGLAVLDGEFYDATATGVAE